MQVGANKVVGKSPWSLKAVAGMAGDNRTLFSQMPPSLCQFSLPSPFGSQRTGLLKRGVVAGEEREGGDRVLLGCIPYAI